MRVPLKNGPGNATITAHCMKRVPIAAVEVWVENRDVVGDDANISSCCSSGSFSRSYIFVGVVGVVWIALMHAAKMKHISTGYY